MWACVVFFFFEVGGGVACLTVITEHVWNVCQETGVCAGQRFIHTQINMLTPVMSSVFYCIYFKASLNSFVLFLPKIMNELSLELTTFWSQTQVFKISLKIGIRDCSDMILYLIKTHSRINHL